MIRLIALDLDGTLLDPAGRITQASKDAIARARAAGVRVVLNTGRPIQEAVWFAGEAGCDALLSCLGGAAVVDGVRGETLRRWDMPEESGRRALELCLGREIELMIFAGEEIVVDPFSKESLSRTYPFPIFHSAAVVAEDLRGYGFQVLWDAEDRTLSVERAADSTGCPALPASWPDYTPPALTQPVGTRAQPILSTDIDTYVAGQYVRSCNIGGETLIWFSDLAPYGAVAFDEDSRTAELTLGDPMQIQLDDLIQRMEDVKEFINVEYQLYPSASGTLFAGSMGGVPHGSSFQLYFVRNNGTKLDIISLLPAYMGGSHSFARYRDIELDDAGTVLTFISPVKETINWATGETKDWGDTLCTVDLVSGTMRSMQPLSQTLTQWSAYYEAETWPEGFLPPTPPLSDGSVSLTLSRPEGTAEVVCLDGSLPSYFMSITVSQDGIAVVHEQGLFSQDFFGTPYGLLYQKLLDLELPSVFQDDSDLEASPEQMAQAAQWLQAAKNGEPIPGNLWWSGGNGHRDLVFDFDQPVTLENGDILTFHMGLPE